MRYRSLALEHGLKTRLLWLAFGLSLVGHAALFALLALIPDRLWNHSESRAVELAIVTTPPSPTPPAVQSLAVPPPPPTREPRKPVIRTPRPNREIPPPKEAPPATVDSIKPIFGVTEESVVKGESAVSVPVGNTIETSEREVAKTPPPPLAPLRSVPSSGPPSMEDESITENAKVLVEVKPEYPPLAKRLGIEGSVMLRLVVDRSGKVKSARIVKKAGYGMDEAALKAIGSFIFSPARGARREPVESTFNYEVRFQQSRAR